MGISFFLSGIIPLLPQTYHHRFLLRMALVSFEMAAPTAILVSVIVTYVLWPEFLKKEGPSRTKRFQRPNVLIQHNLNSFFVLAELALLGKIPISLDHVAFVPLFGIAYILFSWLMATRFEPKTTKLRQEDTNTNNEQRSPPEPIGPQYMYFFLDMTLPGWAPSIHFLGLLCVLLFFYAVLFFSKEFLFVNIYGVDDHSEINIGWRFGCFFVLNYLMCRLKD